jgi:CO/xanthine dehydrogenase FAD-binding subunit
VTDNAQEHTVHILQSDENGGEAHLSLGAQVSLQVVFNAPASPDLMRRILAWAATWQHRNDTTISRAVLPPSVSAQWVASLLALGARVAFREGPGEEKLVVFVRRSERHRGVLAALRLPLNVAGARVACTAGSHVRSTGRQLILHRKPLVWQRVLRYRQSKNLVVRYATDGQEAIG